MIQLSIFLSLLFLLVMGIMSFRISKKKELKSSYTIYEMEILKRIQTETDGVLKIKLITDLDINPKRFNEITKKMEYMGIIKSNDMKISITIFGKKYYTAMLRRNSK